VERMKVLFRSASDAGLSRVEFHDLARYSVKPTSAPYDAIEFGGGSES
jgi:hypothetical protein